MNVERTNSDSRWLWSMIVAFGIFYLATIRSGHSWDDDSAMYIRHAINLLDGIPYDHTGYIRNPWNFLAPIAYPPIFPLLLAPVYKLWGLNLTAMKIEVILFFLLSLWMIYLTFKNEIERPDPIVVLFLFGFNPWIWEFKDQILSEFPYLFFTYLSFFLIQKVTEGDHAAASQVGYGVLSGVSIYLSYGTRTIGLALLLALTIYELLIRRRLSVYLISTVAVAAALIYLQTALLHRDAAAGYFDPIIARGDPLPFQLRLMAEHSWQVVQSFAEFWQNGYSRLLRWATLVIAMATAGVGYFVRAGKLSNVTVLEIFLPLYLAPMIALPVDLEARYLVPIFPLVLFYFLIGLRALSRRLGVERKAVAAAIVVLTAVYLGQYSRSDWRSLHQGLGKAETQQLFDYIKRETRGKDVVLFRKPRALNLFTGRTGAVWYTEQDDEKLWDYFSKINAAYLVAGPADAEPEDQEFIRRFVERNRTRLPEVFANADFHVYRLEREISTR